MFQRSGTTVADGAISGTGTVEQRGTGILSLASADSSYTGTTIFANGVVDAATFGNYGQNSSLGARTAAHEGAQNIGFRAESFGSIARQLGMLSFDADGFAVTDVGRNVMGLP